MHASAHHGASPPVPTGASTGCCRRGRTRASDAPCRARVSCGRSHRARGGGRRRPRAAACLRDASALLWHNHAVCGRQKMSSDSFTAEQFTS
jgi:hypothetical protein